jgi:hypothetical protein
VFQRSKIADLAERIDQRAQQGLTVHLRPATARAVALTMRLYAEGHPSLRQSHRITWKTGPTNPSSLGVLHERDLGSRRVGALRAAVSAAQLIATWGGWIARGSKRGLA